MELGMISQPARIHESRSSLVRGTHAIRYDACAVCRTAYESGANSNWSVGAAGVPVAVPTATAVQGTLSLAWMAMLAFSQSSLASPRAPPSTTLFHTRMLSACTPARTLLP